MRFDMRSKGFAICAVLVLALCSFGALAQQDEPVPLDPIRTQQAAIRAAALAGTGDYEYMSDSTRTEMFAKQAQVLAAIEGKQTSDQLDPNTRVEVFNHLEWIQAAIENAPGQRMVCERLPILGSHRKERVCKTVAQRDRERAESRDALVSKRNQQSLDVPEGQL